MRDGESFDAEGFEINLAACNTAAELVAAFALDAVHREGGGADDYDENAENDEEEDPEAG